MSMRAVPPSKERPLFFNTAISSGVSTASLHALSSIAVEQSAAHSAALAPAASVDDVPPFGTPTPSHPPIPHGLGALISSLLDKVALNPQPLPPKDVGALFAGGKLAAYDDGDWCGTVPHKVPQFPPPAPGP